jgi:hypothetical protein
MSKKDIYKKFKPNNRLGEDVGRWLKKYFSQRTTKVKHKLPKHGM